MSTVPHFRVHVSDARKRAGRATGKIWRIEVRLDGNVKARHFRTKAEATAYADRLRSAMRQGSDFDTDTGQPLTFGPRGQVGGTTLLALAEQVSRQLMRDLAPTSRKSKIQRIAWAVAAVGPLPVGVEPKDAVEPLTKFLRGEELAQTEADIVERIRVVSVPVQRITTEMCEEALVKFRTNLNGQAGATLTVRNRTQGLTHLLNEAVEGSRPLIATSPMPVINTKRGRRAAAQGKKGPTAVSRAGSKDQVRLVLNAAQAIDPNAALFLRILYATGMRPGEVVGLAARDVQDGVLVARRSVTTPGKAWSDGDDSAVGPLKHRAEGTTREVPVMDRDLATELVTLAAELGADDPLVTATPTDAQRAWARARQEVAPRTWPSTLLARPYDLRHSFASQAIEAGVPLTRVAAWLGHSLDVLVKVYAELVEGDDRQWVELMRDQLA